MGNPYIAEIRLFGGTFAPFGWAFCDGSLQSISQNGAMYNLMGTTYGGDGQTTFGLPNLQGRLPVHQGQGPGLSNYIMGQTAGSETVALTAGQLPSHSHGALGSTGSAASNPANATWGNGSIANNTFGPGTSANGSMNAGSIGLTGNGLPHDNLVPFQVVSFIISLEGMYPSQ
ncbi:MAG TPA: tail fiber protein [Candidatus Sulfotelmatobacter sp.]